MVNLNTLNFIFSTFLDWSHFHSHPVTMSFVTTFRSSFLVFWPSSSSLPFCIPVTEHVNLTKFCKPFFQFSYSHSVVIWNGWKLLIFILLSSLFIFRRPNNLRTSHFTILLISSLEHNWLLLAALHSMGEIFSSKDHSISSPIHLSFLTLYTISHAEAMFHIYIYVFFLCYFFHFLKPFIFGLIFCSAFFPSCQRDPPFCQKVSISTTPALHSKS